MPFEAYTLCSKYNLVQVIGANCPEMAGTVPDLAPLSLVPYGSCYSPWISRILKVASLELGY